MHLVCSVVILFILSCLPTLSNPRASLGPQSPERYAISTGELRRGGGWVGNDEGRALEEQSQKGS